MRRELGLVCAWVVALSVSSQTQISDMHLESKKAALTGRDYIESMSYNAGKRGTERTLQYFPQGRDFVCVNGKNRFTRALYGQETSFRIETSDRPVFAVFKKPDNRNISFKLICKNKSIALDSTAYCEARYTPGRRSYVLTDPSWGKGKLSISVLPFQGEEGGVWKIEANNMPRHSKLLCILSPIKAKRLNRNGDMGADPSDSFEASPLLPPFLSHAIELDKKVHYITYRNKDLQFPQHQEGKAIYDKAEKERQLLATQIEINTPDPYFNTLGGALAVAANGIWSGEVWLHGAVGWRMPLSGWRAAYTGDAIGWHDRARKHFDAYAASQVTNVEPIIPHPSQDEEMNLARARKQWGTQMYSNGYICRNPGRNDQMHHYDMNLCYIDELLWHLNWTGDLDYARKMWSVITRHLAWEKRNFDPNDDGLYDAYCCIWASDALQYNSGGVTHSSAYNYRANKMAAEIAEKIGEDGAPYHAEAKKIRDAINKHLWLGGHWAEYKDLMGYGKVHPSAGVWTIYHALDSDVPDPFQAYTATRYIDTEIPHIPVKGKGLADEGYATISTTNWLPYSWSINNVAFAEVMHTALAYWQAGRYEEGFKLLKSSVLDGMYLGNSPGNFGQISFYDAARGECYRDFGDPIGVAARVLVQGLFGVLPDAMNGRLLLRPGFPCEWDHASIKTSDIQFDFKRQKNKDIYKVKLNFEKELSLELALRARAENILGLLVNGEPAHWSLDTSAASGYPMIRIKTDPAKFYQIEIVWGDKSITGPEYEKKVYAGSNWRMPSNGIDKVYDPQRVLTDYDISDLVLSGAINASLEGNYTFFVRRHQGDMIWWQPIDVEISKDKMAETERGLPEFPAKGNYEVVPMDGIWNASVTDIFKNSYLTPRSPYTTLQVPKQGLGEWCHPKETADINDTGLRARLKNGLLESEVGIPFLSAKEGNNIVFTTLWDNYPDSISVPLTGNARHIFLLMAGTTNHMQCHFVNGIVTVNYKDGTQDTLELINPETWCPIEQDYFTDGLAFSIKEPRPYRLHFKTGKLVKEFDIEGVYGRRIDGGAGILLDLPLDASKELDYLQVKTIANEVIIGLMAVTLLR